MIFFAYIKLNLYYLYYCDSNISQYPNYVGRRSNKEDEVRAEEA